MALVLLVEDNEMNRDMLMRRLERKGYQVITAVDGMEGVVTARKQKPDIILMDVNLPEISGWEATRIIKSSEATASIPVIAITAHATSEDRRKSDEAGCDDYDTKPVHFQRLVEKINKLLDKGGHSPPDR